MEQEEETIWSWLEALLPISELSTKLWKDKLGPELSIYQQVRHCLYLMLLRSIKRKVTNLLSLEEKSMALDLAGTGPQKDLSYRE